MPAAEFTVYLQGQKVGDIIDVSLDWPWHSGTFMPDGPFEAYRNLFNEYPNSEDDCDLRDKYMQGLADKEFELVHEKTGKRLRAMRERQGEVFRFILDLENTKVRFRILTG